MPSLDPYTSVLGRRKAKHLLRRATLNFSKSQIDHFSGLTPQAALAILCQPVVNKLNRPIDVQESDPADQDWLTLPKLPNEISGHGRKRIAITAWWWYNGYNQTSLQHKMSFFLHSCFTVAKDNGAGASHYFYDHLLLLMHFSLGNVKNLAKKITLDNSMLYYLDNYLNNANNPNENYAREFLELFTILKGKQIGDGNYTNYTEHDVQMAAKVFSGFRHQPDRSIIDTDTNLPKGYPKPSLHDKNDKTFSASFGNAVIKGGVDEAGMEQEHNDFVEMIFAQDATAISYVRKLYRFFVKSEWSAEVESNIIVPLAQQLKIDNYDLMPTVKKLLASKHFYDEDDNDNSNNIIGSIVKHPLQLVSEILSAFEVPVVDATKAENEKEFYLYLFKNFIHNSCFAGAGLTFFSPDSVAGYPAMYQEPDFDRHWFSSTTIVARYKIIQSLLLGKNLIAGWGKFTAVVDSVRYAETEISNPGDVDVLINELAEYLYPESISEDRKAYFSKVLLEDFDKTYWIGAWSDYVNNGTDTTVRIRLDALLTAMVNAAEFQLM